MREIYRIAPEQLQPGLTLSEIVERRVAAGTAALAADAYLATGPIGQFRQGFEDLDLQACRWSDHSDLQSADARRQLGGHA